MHDGKLKNKIVEDISFKSRLTILKEHKINIKSLPGYCNMGLRKKYIKPYVENKSDSKTAVNIPLE